MNGTFIMQKTYFEKGFFNIRKRYSDDFDKAGTPLKVSLDGASTVTSIIDRTSNNNGCPRIYIGHKFKEWAQKNYSIGDVVRFEIISRNHIRLFSKIL